MSKFEGRCGQWNRSGSWLRNEFSKFSSAWDHQRRYPVYSFGINRISNQLVNFRPTIALAAIVLLTLSTLCFAQTFSASIAGSVKDPAGAVVNGAKVQLQNVNTHDTRDFTTDSDGLYKFDNLLPGTYEITAQAPGFSTYVQTNMLLRANTAASVNISLQLGSTEQKIEVTGEALLLDTQSANNSVTLDSHLIEGLPNNTRNPLNFVFALAGTTEAQGGMTSRSGSFDQNGSMFGLNGGRSGNEEILIDGAPSQAVDWGGLMVSPINDSVQEQQVVQNEFDAQYERAGAGVVTLITKSGSNSFHGEVYDFLRNSALDANTWSNNRNGSPKGEFHRNQFGANFGGPLLKRYNLYFFGAYEGLRQPETDSSGLLTVPTAAERQGDFSQTFNYDGTPSIIYNPFTTRLVTDAQGNQTYTRDAFPGNKIPSNLFNSVGQKILSLYPMPNRPAEGANQINNYYAQGKGTTANDKFDWRIDWDQSATNRLFVRMSDRVRQNNTPACFFCNGADQSANNDDNGFQVVVNDTYTPSPTWVIDSYIAVSRWHESQTSIGYGKADASTIGLSTSDFQAPILPLISTDFYTGLGSTYSSYNRYVRDSDTAQVNFTKELSSHTLKFGANYSVGLINNIQNVPGSFSFSTGLTSCDPNPAGGACLAQNASTTLSGNSIATMLLGVGSGSSLINMNPAMSLHTYGAYLQDQWRVNQRLTVTAGLRYENQRPATERYNRLAYFNENVVNPISAAVAPLLGRQVMGGFQFANGSNRFAWPAENLNFAPRLGVAFKITDKLVARAGAGIFYAPASAMISYDSPGQFLGFNSTTNYTGTIGGQGYIPQGSISDPFPNGLTQPVGSSQGLNTYVGLGAGQVWPKAPHPTGYSEQWSFDLQYQLGSHSVIEAGYTGVRGRKLMYGNPDLNADQLSGQYLALGSQLDQQVPNPFNGIITDPSSGINGPTVAYNQLLRPFPQYTNLQWNRSLPGAHSEFNALNVKYTHAFNNGLSLISTYQWSKALDNGSEDFIGWATGNAWRDSNNTNLDYSVSAHDVPQSFATAFVYQLPYGKGKHWGTSAPFLVSQVLGNWELSSTVRFASGMPLSKVVWDYFGNPLSKYGFPGPEIPNLVGNPKPASQTTTQWINGAAYTEASPYSLGNAPQHDTHLREGANKDWDLAVMKNFGSERFKVQFRGEFLNVFNHPIYGGWGYGGSAISTCIDCGDLGTVYGTRNDPRNIQFSLKAMF